MPKKTITGSVISFHNNTYTIHPITSIYSFNGGSEITYQSYNNQDEHVFIPIQARPITIGNTWYIGHIIGNNSCISFACQPCDPDCPGHDLTALIKTNIAYKAFKRLHKPMQGMAIIIIIAIIAIAVIAFMAIKQFGAQGV